MFLLGRQFLKFSKALLLYPVDGLCSLSGLWPSHDFWSPEVHVDHLCHMWSLLGHILLAPHYVILVLTIKQHETIPYILFFLTWRWNPGPRACWVRSNELQLPPDLFIYVISAFIVLSFSKYNLLDPFLFLFKPTVLNLWVSTLLGGCISDIYIMIFNSSKITARK